MIVVTVELWPFGDPANIKVLERLTISNDGTGDATTGNYFVVATNDHHGPWTGNVENHPRRLSPWYLVLKALRATLPPTHPKQKRGAVSSPPTMP